MSLTAGSEVGEEHLGEGTMHDGLRNERRQLLIKMLLDGNGTANVGEVAGRIAARESDPDPPKNRRRSGRFRCTRPIS